MPKYWDCDTPAVLEWTTSCFGSRIVLPESISDTVLGFEPFLLGVDAFDLIPQLLAYFMEAGWGAAVCKSLLSPYTLCVRLIHVPEDHVPDFLR